MSKDNQIVDASKFLHIEVLQPMKKKAMIRKVPSCTTSLTVYVQKVQSLKQCIQVIYSVAITKERTRGLHTS